MGFVLILTGLVFLIIFSNLYSKRVLGTNTLNKIKRQSCYQFISSVLQLLIFKTTTHELCIDIQREREISLEIKINIEIRSYNCTTVELYLITNYSRRFICKCICFTSLSPLCSVLHDSYQLLFHSIKINSAIIIIKSVF